MNIIYCNQSNMSFKGPAESKKLMQSFKDCSSIVDYKSPISEAAKVKGEELIRNLDTASDEFIKCMDPDFELSKDMNRSIFFLCVNLRRKANILASPTIYNFSESLGKILNKFAEFNRACNTRSKYLN